MLAIIPRSCSTRSNGGHDIRGNYNRRWTLLHATYYEHGYLFALSCSNAGPCWEISQAKYHPAHCGHQHHNIFVLHLAETTITTYGPLYSHFELRKTASCNTNIYFAQKPAHINELYISNWHVLQQTSHISLNKKNTKKNDQPIKHETVMDKFMVPRISFRSLGVRSDVCCLRCEGEVWALKLPCFPRCATWVELGGHAVYGVECNPFLGLQFCFVRKRSKSFCRRAWDWVVVAGKVCLSWELQNMNSLFLFFCDSLC